jgi:hypothetical protein
MKILWFVLTAIGFLFTIVFLPTTVSGQSHRTAINPGIKLGYEFGDNGGFVFGVEISLVVEKQSSDYYYYGFVLSTDKCRDLKKYHIGVEGGRGLMGICIGPSFLSQKGEHDFGLTVTPYYGGLLIPYLSITTTVNSRFIGEIGSYVKIPIPAGGNWWNND